MTTIISKDKLIDYFVILLFVITSGSVFYKINFSGSLTYILLLLVGFVNKQRIKRNKAYNKIESNNSWWFIVFVSIWAIIGTFYYSHSYDDKNLLGYIFILLAAYFIISSYNFCYFRKLLTNVIFVITLIGIPIFLLSEINILPTYTLKIPSGTEYTMFFTYTLGWPAIFHRYSGIWHEPGACQIFSNTVLWLYLDSFIKWKWNKGELKKIMVIGAGSVLTLSTGSFISLMLLLASVALKSNIKSKHRIAIKVLVVLGAIVVVTLLFSSDVIQNKLFKDDTIEANTSKVARTADALALYQMTLNRPWLGYGLGTHDYWTTTTKLGNTANSTGLLTFSASFGVVWLIVFVVIIFIRIIKMGYGGASIFMLISVLLMQFNENYV